LVYIVSSANKIKQLTIGFLVGLAAGYFGIGGGFIIVPSLMHLGLNIIGVSCGGILGTKFVEGAPKRCDLMCLQFF
jgi:hypothetical protein